MLTRINENAKWVIYISIAGIIAGLLFMDMSSLQVDKRSPIGTVNGEKLSNELFSLRLSQLQAQQKGLSEEQTSQMREELFRSFVQQSLMQKTMDNMKVTASVYEMSRDLRADPPQGIDREPMFQTDGVFDFAKYEAWLNDPSTYDSPFMQEYENMLKVAKIPEKQVRVFLGAGIHPSTLEAKYNVLNREIKFEILNAQGNMNAFAEPSISPSSIDSVFKAELDSFFVVDDLAKIQYVALPLEPSKSDVENTFEYAKMLLAQIKDGADFAEIARNSSDDPGSAALGGELGDYSARGKWVREFDSAAFALDSGAISNPVRTQFGYHIIQSLGKRVEDEEEQVKARHILLAVSASRETADSLSAILTEVKSSVDAGKTFEEAAKAKGLNPQLSGWFKKGGEIAELGYLSGLSSYTFFNPLRPKEISKTSDVLQNSKWLVLAEKADNLTAGSRNLEFAQSRIEQNLKAAERSKAAAEHLKAKLYEIEKISVIDEETKHSIEKVSIDSVLVSFESYFPGLGYANPEIYNALATAKEGQWSGPYISPQGAVMIKILEKSVPGAEELKSAIEDELSMSWQYGSFSAYSDYMRNLEANAKIVNNLDLYYRE